MAIWLTSGRGLATVTGMVTVALIAAVVIWKNTEPEPGVQAEQPLLAIEPVVSNPAKTAKSAVEKNKATPVAAKETVPAEETKIEKGLAGQSRLANQTPVAPVRTDLNTDTPEKIVATPQPDTAVPVQAQTAMTDPEPVQTSVVVAEPVAKTPAVAPVDVPVKVAAAPDVVDTPVRPVLDLVRVDAQGGAVVAGTAAPGATVRIRFGEETLQSVQADANGAFVVLLDLPTGTAPRPLVLEGLAGEVAVPSAESVLVMPFAKDNSLAPKLVMASAKGVTILQDDAALKNTPEITTAPAPVAVDVQGVELAAPGGVPQGGALSLDTIAYDKTGDVVLAGRGQSDQQVRVYLNNKPIQTETVRSDGQWQVVLPEVQEGVHTLRVDATDAVGKVSARVESPFKRETPDVVAAADQGSITVQPGHTLWALAEDKYGDGVKYVQIFQANRDRIRDPDLIYPGQVFELPK